MSWVTKFGTVLFGSTIPYFSYRHPDVKEALAGQRPVVALESTIITQGMPYLHNLSTVKEVEVIVRAEGAVPATTGILEGRIHVGLSGTKQNITKSVQKRSTLCHQQGFVGWHNCLRHNDCGSQGWDSCLCNRRHWRST
ncbi:pseudouridine-5'-phosphate glycosidase-like [Cyprinus carpio]|uniref:Pseudouridine-5'-phosphate glycosidase-like n=1 Tax=Cyprinus carpio TaxID=7962 RepID=A0A9Q9VUC3_CYPCA|nr:pseudouridine-5'-phosphate glycosidase-like [Cyprinus carpio]